MEFNNNEKIFNGVLEGFWETGTEGIIWSIYKDGLKGYDALETIQNGDHLTVWQHGNEVPIFDDKIVCDYQTGWRPFPLNPSYGQQSALGYWVHWVQTGMHPDAWARLFFPKDHIKQPHRARIIRCSEK